MAITKGFIAHKMDTKSQWSSHKMVPLAPQELPGPDGPDLSFPGTLFGDVSPKSNMILENDLVELLVIMR
jgi:hypothetical protein